MKKWLLLLWPLIAFGQSIPNGTITQGQVWTPAQWNAAWSSKADVTNPAYGALPANTILGNSTDILAPAIALPVVYVFCTGVTAADDALISAAIATGNAVHIVGSCTLGQAFTIATGADVYGDGDHLTFLNINSTFPSGQTGVFNCTGAALNSCSIHDLGFIGAGPGTFLTTAASTVGAGSGSFTVNAKPAGSGPWYIIDKTAASIQNLTTVTFTGAGPYTATLSQNTIGTVTSSDSIGITVTRAGYAALGTCNATTIPCEYPPMIYDVTAGSRPRLRHLHMETMWQCIDLQGATTGNTPPWIDSIECDALSIGLKMDGQQDFSHIHGWHHWDFGYCNGFGASSLCGTPYCDGTTIAMQLGRADGINANDLSFFDARFVVTSNASNSATPWVVTNFMADGQGSSVEINGGFDTLISSFYKTGGTNGSTCPVTATAGTLRLSNVDITDATTSTTSEVCVSGTAIADVDSGRFTHNNTAEPAFLVSTSTAQMAVEDIKFSIPNMSFTAPYINQTAGILIVQNDFSNATVGPCVAISATTDTTSGLVSNNNFVSCTYSFPASPLGNYSGNNVPMTWPATDPTSVGGGAGSFQGFPTSAVTLNDTAFGYQAMSGVITSAAVKNTAMGSKAGAAITSGIQNTCVGASACAGVTSGPGNTGIGLNALQTVTSTTAGSTAIGVDSLDLLASGTGANVAVGSFAGDKCTTCNNNLYLGYNVGSVTQATGSNNVIIGTSNSCDTAAAATAGTIEICAGSTAVWSATGTTTPSTSVTTIAGTQSINGPLITGQGGTTFTVASGTATCGTTSTLHGGVQAGDFTCTTAGTAASTVTLTIAATTTAYTCWGRDITTPTTVTQTGAKSTTSVTLTLTSVTANDVIQFGCLGY